MIVTIVMVNGKEYEIETTQKEAGEMVKDIALGMGGFNATTTSNSSNAFVFCRHIAAVEYMKHKDGRKII